MHKTIAAFFVIAFVDIPFHDGWKNNHRSSRSFVEASIGVKDQGDPSSNPSCANIEEGTMNRVPLDCTLVMAPSSIPGNSGWGVFTLHPQAANSLAMDGDIVIQLVDLNEKTARGMRRLVWEYLWDGAETGGQYEGQKVSSLIPGLGTLANGAVKGSNLKYIADRKRTNGNLLHAGAGAFTYYQNVTWRYSKQVNAGDELLVNYGKEWFQERGFGNTSIIEQANRSISDLRQNGYCLDNVIAGKESKQPYAGRGAFAKRNLAKGSIVAPIPVLPLTRDSLELLKEAEDGKMTQTYQMMLNYCFGDSQSNILLYPYSPIINLINHASDSNSETLLPNVYLRWSPDSNQQSATGAPKRMLLEMVAIRDIKAGEEILLNYGKKWEEAWKAHLQSYDTFQSNRHPSAWDLDKKISIIPTVAEQQRSQSPNPDIFTSCYYKYENSGDLQQEQDQGRTIFRWKETSALLSSPRYLRPCLILERIPSHHNLFSYKVQVLNRPGLAKVERIPKASFPHVVTNLPREAIVFSDKIYTTDQHLPTAFRHEIGLDVFPKEWINKSL